ncbi:hypothetical protein KZZ52_29690 [Dactylosporangium sp. AC04546]|uniref:hypothetical protein n=1 Tax=Dactylosporangium sp. AC04546 TaxID=2862460 RepID=UPI001EDF0EBE|nr:hypothetical protein [Dactylosporangium sp. AC04546]WVK78171.1 hypothetical protein KZZ52_29690 [Dactylosporangium sp. AC04546]
MPPPTPETITAAVAALRDDAAAWLTAAIDLSLVRLPPLTVAELSAVAGHCSVFMDGATALLASGSLACAATANALQTAAAGYERDEAAAVHRLRQTW